MISDVTNEEDFVRVYDVMLARGWVDCFVAYFQGVEKRVRPHGREGCWARSFGWVKNSVRRVFAG